MDPLSAIGAMASVAGIISLGIQISQILQKQIDDVRNADERLLQIVHEIRGTAAALASLQDILVEEEKRGFNRRIFSVRGRRDIWDAVTRCNGIFRNIAVLLAKADRAVLAQVDEFQRKISKRGGAKPDQEITLNIEMCNIEHLVWPWRRPKIEQYVADLYKMSQLISLLLLTAALGRKKAVGAEDSDSSTECESDEEDLLIDKLYYRDQSYQEAEGKSSRHIIISRESNDSSTKKSSEAAQELVQNWPNLPDGSGVSDALELQQLGIWLTAYALEIHDSRTKGCPWVPILTSQADILKQALRSLDNKSILDTQKQLPTYQLHEIYHFLENRIAEGFSNRPSLVGIEICRHRRKRFMERLKSFTSHYGHGPSRCHLVLFLAWTPAAREPDYERVSPFTLNGQSPGFSRNGRDTSSRRSFGRDHDYRGHSRYEKEPWERDPYFLSGGNHHTPMRSQGTYPTEASYDEPRVRFSQSPVHGSRDERHRANSPWYGPQRPIIAPPILETTPPYDPIYNMRKETSWPTGRAPTTVHAEQDGQVIRDEESPRSSRTHYPERFYSRERSVQRRPLFRTITSGLENLDDSADPLPPTEEEKISIAEYYLRMWTTAWGALQTRLHGKAHWRGEYPSDSHESRPDFFSPRPKEPPRGVSSNLDTRAVRHQQSYERLRRRDDQTIGRPSTGEQLRIEDSSGIETLGTRRQGGDEDAGMEHGIDGTSGPGDGILGYGSFASDQEPTRRGSTDEKLRYEDILEATPPENNTDVREGGPRDPDGELLDTENTDGNDEDYTPARATEEASHQGERTHPLGPDDQIETAPRLQEPDDRATNDDRIQ